MRLIDVKTYRFREFYDQVPSYAILSHTWTDEELTCQEWRSKDVRAELKHTAGYKKIVSCCKQAEIDGLRYVWVDTCSIDKSSSAELSEAINSMYRWYSESEICYAYLSDVSFHEYEPKDMTDSHIFEFARSRWFTRGYVKS